MFPLAKANVTFIDFQLFFINEPGKNNPSYINWQTFTGLESFWGGCVVMATDEILFVCYTDTFYFQATS